MTLYPFNLQQYSFVVCIGMCFIDQVMIIKVTMMCIYEPVFLRKSLRLWIT